MAQTSPLPPETLEQLSAYLDGQLSKPEQQQLEERLVSDPSWQAELASLRAVSQLLHQLPTKRVPHDFILTPDMVKIPRFLFFPATRSYSVFSAVAAVLLVALGVRFLLNSPSLNVVLPTANSIASEEVFRSAQSVAVLPTVSPLMTESAPMVSAFSAPMLADGFMDSSEEEATITQLEASVPSGMVTLPSQEGIARIGESAPILQLEAITAPAPTATLPPTATLAPAPTATLIFISDQPQDDLTLGKRIMLFNERWIAWGTILIGMLSGAVAFGTTWVRRFYR